MKIDDFAVEIWMNEYETTCSHNLAETCVRSLSIDELLDLSGRRADILAELGRTRMTYGPIPGSDRLRTLVASLFTNQTADNVIITHGAIGANALVHEALVEPGDRVIAVRPNYQQHYSIPASYGAGVQELWLTQEGNWLPDLDRLDDLATDRTKLIALTNPNNPTGSLMDEAMLNDVVAIARRCGAWILADEVYRGIDQHGDGTTASVADLYERGISTGSMSKPFGLAGLRLGWIVGPQEVLEPVSIHRNYNTISVSRVDDLFASVGLEHKEQILDRGRRITRENLAVLDRFMTARDDLDWVKPTAATVTLIRYYYNIESYDLCRRLLAETGVMFMPGDAFDIPRTFRIGFADDLATLEAGLDRFGGYLDGLGKTG
ncbi:MAG: aminotransferase class I/II-fold pyridoxal phosphate-dependent enzyme [Actinomycetota bacterium]